MSDVLQGRIVPSNGSASGPVAVDLRIDVDGRAPFERRIRMPFVVELPSGARVDIDPSGAELIARPRTQRGAWATVVRSELGSLASEYSVGPHVEVELTGRIFRVGDHIEIHGEPRSELVGNDHYRTATMAVTSIRATQLAEARVQSAPRPPNRFTVASVAAMGAALLCASWATLVAASSFFVSGAPFDAATRVSTVTAMALVALELWRRARGYPHLLPGSFRRSWLPQLRAPSGTERVAVTEAGERNVLVAALVVLAGPIAGFCLLMPQSQKAEWTAEAGVILGLLPALTVVLSAALAWPSRASRRDERLAAAMVDALDRRQGPWVAVRGALDARALLRRQVDAWSSTSGTRYTVMRTVVQERFDLPAAVTVTAAGGPIEVELREAAFGSTVWELRSRRELESARPDDDRAFSLEWLGPPSAPVLAVGALEQSRLVAHGPESVAILVTEPGQSPELVLRRGLVAARASRWVLALGVLSTGAVAVLHALS